MVTNGKLETFAWAAAIFAILLGSSPSWAQPYSCSASAAALISRSTGGTCAAALAPGTEFTLSYRVTNASIVDDPGGPMDGTAVSAVLLSGRTIDAILAQTIPFEGAPELPGLLEFVPVCPVGSTGGSLAAGDECDPDLAECGPGYACGCVSAVTGVTCTPGVDINRVDLSINQDVSMSPGQTRTVATIRVRRGTGDGGTTNCGEFFTHMHTQEDILEVADPLCESLVTAGAEAMADLHAPECFADTDCGDTDCNICAEAGSDNHCEAANLGGPCGTDGNLTDCLTPACVDNAGEGECQQDQNPVGEGTSCNNNGGAPVSAVECQIPLCDAVGTCANAPDATQDGDPCGTDSNLQDCLTPACLAGGCAQEQNPVGAGASCTNNGGVPVSAVECQIPECDAGGTCENVADASQDGNACGTDSNLQDCLTPACLTGSCAQEQNPVAAGVSCTNNGGTSVPAVDCQVPLCDAGGICANVPDPAQDGDPCADLDPGNCYLARCASGGCNQLAICEPTENPAVCRVTISDTIFRDDNADGIQDAGEPGLAGVEVDVLACSAGVPSIPQGTVVTNGSGHYSFSMPTCNPSETLAIDVSDSFAGALSGYIESPAFCDADDPDICGVEVTPALDSNCTNGVSDCRTIDLSTEDPTVDCGYSLCGNGTVDAGEQCDAPGSEICNNGIDDDGDLMVDCSDPDCEAPGYQSCDANCQLAPPCVPILRDPTTLTWDRFKMHGYFVPTTAVNPLVDGFVVLISNEDGEVFRGELFAGDLKERGNGENRKYWKFKDRGARSGEGIRGGISRVWVKQRLDENGEKAFPFRIDVYGDMSRATRARMTVQVYLRDDVGFLTATWQGEPGRWYLTRRQAEAGLVNE